MSQTVCDVGCSRASSVACAALAACLGAGQATPALAEGWSPELGVSARILSDRKLGVLNEVSVNPAAQYQAGRTLFRSSARIRLYDKTLLDSEDRDDHSYWGASRPFVSSEYVSAELREFYLTTAAGRWVFDIGKRQLNWGTLDGYRILDAVNPQDFREFILDDFSNSRIETWMARAEYSGSDWRLEFVYSPDRTVHDLADASTAFELTASRFRLGQTGNDSPPAFDVDPPRQNQAALRYTRNGRNWDFSAVYIQGFGFEPVIRLDRASLTQSFPDRQFMGVSAAVAVGPALFRTEIGYESAYWLNGLRDELPSAGQAQRLSAALGADVDGPWGLFLNFQLIRDTLHEARIEPFRPEKDTIVTAYARKTFRNDTLQLDVRFYEHIEDDGTLWRARLGYDLSGIGRLVVGADVFSGGTPDGLFGQYANRDRVYLRWEKTF